MRTICGACTVRMIDRQMCPPCAARARRNALIGRAAVAGAALLGVGALVVFLLMSGKEDQGSGTRAPAKDGPAGRTTAPAAFDHGEYAYTVQSLRKRLEVEPCDRRAALDLGDTLNTAGDFRGAIEFTNKFIADCGEFYRLLWVSFHAHKELEDWDSATMVCTEIIQHDPTDSDYWWWRGEVYAEAKRLQEATADYLQSMASKPNGFAAWRYSDMVDRTERACEGAFAFQLYIDHRPDQDTDEAAQRRSELWLAHDCDRRVGKGRAIIKFKPEAPIIKSPARINGKAVSAMVSPSTGLVIVSRKLAGELGLTVADEPSITAYLAGQMITAKPLILDAVELTGARAEAISAAVIDEVPGGFDAVIGTSFLWRFDVEIDEQSISLADLRE